MNAPLSPPCSCLVPNTKIYLVQFIITKSDREFFVISSGFVLFKFEFLVDLFERTYRSVLLQRLSENSDIIRNFKGHIRGYRNRYGDRLTAGYFWNRLPRRISNPIDLLFRIQFFLVFDFRRTFSAEKFQIVAQSRYFHGEWMRSEIEQLLLQWSNAN